jgi:hypothetical protein
VWSSSTNLASTISAHSLNRRNWKPLSSRTASSRPLRYRVRSITSSALGRWTTLLPHEWLNHRTQLRSWRWLNHRTRLWSWRWLNHRRWRNTLLTT